MRSGFRRGRIISKLALLAMLASVVGGHVATAAAAAPANTVSGDRSLFESAPAGDGASSATLPTLTNDVGQPSDGAESQLSVGIVLLALGVLGLVGGLAAILVTRRRTRPAGALASVDREAKAVLSMQPRA